MLLLFGGWFFAFAIIEGSDPARQHRKHEPTANADPGLPCVRPDACRATAAAARACAPTSDGGIEGLAVAAARADSHRRGALVRGRPGGTGRCRAPRARILFRRSSPPKPGRSRRIRRFAWTRPFPATAYSSRRARFVRPHLLLGRPGQRLHRDDESQPLRGDDDPRRRRRSAPSRRHSARRRRLPLRARALRQLAGRTDRWRRVGSPPSRSPFADRALAHLFLEAEPTLREYARSRRMSREITVK